MRLPERDTGRALGVVFGRHARGFRLHPRPHFRIIAGECLIAVGCFEHRSAVAPPRGAQLCSDTQHPTIATSPTPAKEKTSPEPSGARKGRSQSLRVSTGWGTNVSHGGTPYA